MNRVLNVKHLKSVPRKFYQQNTETVAKNLLSKYLVRVIDNHWLIGKIVETEAYLGQFDLASHSRFGQTKRNQVMFGPAGVAYVYLIYGIHHCLNVVTETSGQGSAVLIRALEPIQNLSVQTNGPGKLCKTLQIDLSLNGIDITKKGKLFILTDKKKVLTSKIHATPRIGVSYAHDWAHKLLRFCLKGNKWVSNSSFD